MEKDISTEQKIKEAAKRVFQKKGLGLTRTRDIAEEAGINLALLNYYFRSKEKLFDIVMEESVREMFSFISHIINDRKTTLPEKIDLAVERYIEGLLKNPHLPLFVFSELQANPQKLFKKMGASENVIGNSSMYEQLQEQVVKKELNIEPLHFFINLVSLSIFPILAKPFFLNIHRMKEEDYLSFINERKTLVSEWLKSMLQLEE